ncbi:MAG: response regulator [Gammaproteobacteria bacterium]|nr:MAG: response regulator [Gammaproteobacteria bacterium]
MAKILVVDDDDAVRVLIRDSLELDGHDIDEASTGKGLMETFDIHNIDLIVTDLVMPDKSGIDVIMEIKKAHPDIHIVAISGGGGITGRFDYLPIAKLIGAQFILRKPFQMKELRDIVNEQVAA